jgi:acyl carrier protein
MLLSFDALTSTIRYAMSEALGQDMTVDADFFAEGGDSLAAEIVLTALSSELSISLPGWILLDYPTPLSLARALAPTVSSECL